MQNLQLPLHRSGSAAQKKWPRRLSSSQLQLVAFVSFIALLCMYLAYNVRTLLAAAKARQVAEADRSAPRPVPQPDEDQGIVFKPLGVGRPKTATAQQKHEAAAPGSVHVASAGARQAFSGWRHGAGPRRAVARAPSSPANNSGGGGDPPLRSQAPRPGPGLPAEVHGRPPNVRRTGAADAGDRARPAVRNTTTQRLPEQAEGPHEAARAGEDPSPQEDEEFRKAAEQTVWLVKELRAHYKRACAESKPMRGSPAEQACSRLLEIGRKLGDDQVTGGVPQLVMALRAHAFALVEAVRQSLGDARPGATLVDKALAVMKELSVLGRTELRAARGQPGALGGGLFGADDFLDAHVGAHPEDDPPGGSAPFGRPPSGRPGHTLDHQNLWAQHAAQGAAALHQRDRQRGQRPHQQVHTGSVGVNRALVGGAARHGSHKDAGGRHAPGRRRR
uniref:Transmembrane protein n=2 Tax=Tetraselmis sp. GSL018 TaxID=582737 RepID=A0A061S8W4_9CHLO|mmetsp:Transcript_23630/g.56447  ORF Transcript_23630/g.56447 Transcript_23630/m.56447 type:complete len:447 (-) Transcript_23630:119-1459(-)